MSRTKRGDSETVTVFSGTAQDTAIGFGQPTDAGLEDSGEDIAIRISPGALAVNISLRVLPFTYDDFQTYIAANTRDIPSMVQDQLDVISDLDTAEST